MNYSHAVGVARFILVILVIALLFTVAIYGFEPWNIGGVFDEGTITLGLDLQGGSVITFRANAQEGDEITSDGMNSLLQAMRTRLDSAGLTEASAYLVGSDMITIEIPGDTDPNEAVENFGATGKLSFKMYNSETGDYDKTVLTGDDVKNAYAAIDNDNQYCVALNFTSEGGEKFYEITSEVASLSGYNYLYIYMDDEVISAPSVSSGIEGGSCTITQSSGMEADYAYTLAGNINSGALKYDLELASTSAVGPTLGEKSLSTSLKAGAIGIALVIIFMIVVYRIPGLMASIALAAYTAVFMLLLSLLGANLTLPGIAGIVLSIGMAVDANVVIFERMKEEINNGKSTKCAIKDGFSKAFSAILDSNVTTFIAAAVLYFLGSGTIQGFAVTLGLGVIISFFTALVVTRLLLNIGCSMGLTKISLYGVKERSAK